MTETVDLTAIKASDCAFTTRARSCFRFELGDPTLAELNALSDAELLRTPNLGYKTLKEIRAVVAAVGKLSDYETETMKEVTLLAPYRARIAELELSIKLLRDENRTLRRHVGLVGQATAQVR